MPKGKPLALIRSLVLSMLCDSVPFLALMNILNSTSYFILVTLVNFNVVWHLLLRNHTSLIQNNLSKIGNSKLKFVEHVVQHPVNVLFILKFKINKD